MDNEKLFRDAPVWKAVGLMAATSCIAILVITLYDIADMYFIGRLNDTSQIAAVSIAGPVFSLMGALAMMLGNGSSALIARAIGLGQKDRARTYSSLCFWGCILSGLTLSVFIFLFHGKLLPLLGATGETYVFAEGYMLIRLFGIPFVLLSTAMANCITAEGAVIQGLIGNLIATVVNLVLDPLMILGLGMGIRGAALATVAGNVAGCVYYLLYIVREADAISLDVRFAAKLPTGILEIIAVGFPSAIASVLGGLASTFGNRLLVPYGVDAVAGFAAASRASFVVAVIQMGICLGTQSLIAYTYGTGNILRLKEILQKIVMLTGGLGVVLAVLCLFGRHFLVGLFLTEPSAAAIATQMTVFLIIGTPFIGLHYLALSLMQAMGKARKATLLSVLREGLLLIPLLLLLQRLAGVSGIPIAYTITDIAATCIGAAVILKTMAGIHPVSAKTAETAETTETAETAKRPETV